MSIHDFEKPSVTVDIVTLKAVNTYINSKKGPGKALSILLVKRDEEPFKNKWSLPGGFVNVNENLEDKAKSKLLEKTGVKDLYLEQLYTFSDINRDPRGRVISVAYMALTNDEKLNQDIISASKETKWFTINDNTLISEDETINIKDLAFDHQNIIKTALSRLNGKIEYTDVAFHLLPHKFTIKEIQLLFECIMGYRIDSFQRKMGNRIIETDEIIKVVGRPARLFIFNKEWKYGL